MRSLRHSLFVRCALLPMMLSTFLTSCFKWVPLEPPVQASIEQKRPGKVRLRLQDGSDVTIDSPEVINDSIAGYDAATTKKVPESVTVLLAEIVSAEVWSSPDPRVFPRAWHPLRGPPSELLPSVEAERIRLTLADGTVQVVETPQFADGAISGLDPDRRSRPRVAVPLESVAAAHNRTVNVGRTIFLSLAALVPVGFVVGMSIYWSDHCMVSC